MFCDPTAKAFCLKNLVASCGQIIGLVSVVALAVLHCVSSVILTEHVIERQNIYEELRSCHPEVQDGGAKNSRWGSVQKWIRLDLSRQGELF